MRAKKWAYLVPVLGAALGSFVLPDSAQAISLSAAAALTGGNTADNKSGTNAKLENKSTASVPDTGGTVGIDFVGAVVDAKAVYQAVLLADRDDNGSSNRTQNMAWQVTFSVTAPAGITYDLKIDTSRLGALTAVDDTGNVLGLAEAKINALTGSYSGPGTPAGTLNMGSQVFPGILGQEFDGQNDSINQSAILTVTGLAGTNVAQNFTLTFTSSAFVQSLGFAGVFGVGAYQADEAAVRLGLASTHTGQTAATYPGPGGRTAANDGHIVAISATVTAVPEPSTFALAGLGALGIGLATWRRRRAA